MNSGDIGQASSMGTQYPEPDPHHGPGRGPGGGVPPEETPAGEGSTGAETGPRDKQTRGWAKGPAIVLGILVVLCAAFFIAYAVIVAL
ncbi:DUF6480 family protein [Streptomyces platensis]|uniref:DUF6480 family protein n=1 Tax=Streptomyces platensis TaxID=58346 RepID=UPI0036BE40C6